MVTISCPLRNSVSGRSTTTAVSTGAPFLVDAADPAGQPRIVGVGTDGELLHARDDGGPRVLLQPTSPSGRGGGGSAESERRGTGFRLEI